MMTRRLAPPAGCLVERCRRAGVIATLQPAHRCERDDRTEGHHPQELGPQLFGGNHEVHDEPTGASQNPEPVGWVGRNQAGRAGGFGARSPLRPRLAGPRLGQRF